MNLEAQLLQIIEEQQTQLKQQQQLIEQKCVQLNLVQEKLTKTLKEQGKLLNVLESLEQYTSRHKDSLTAHFSRVEEKLKSLESQALPEIFLSSLQQKLEQHLQQLVTGLNIESQAEAMMQRSLPKILQAEIDKQITPLVQQFLKEKEKVINFQGELAVLVKAISSRL